MSTRKILFCCVVGTMLEWYDFAIFGILSPILAKLFFPHEDKITMMLISFALFAVSFIMRPLGGILLGHIGDRYGRKKAVVLSILLMTVASTSIGFLPTNHHSRIIIPLLLLLRLLQGLSVGGEFPGIVTYAGELATSNKFFSYQSVIYLGLNGGVLLGAIVSSFFLSLHIKDAWRFPFILSILLGVIGYYLRTKACESPIFQQLNKNNQTVSLPIKVIIKKYWKPCVAISLIMASSSIAYWYILIYYPSYVYQKFHPGILNYLGMSALSAAFMMIFMPIFCLMANKKIFLIIISIGITGLTILALPTLIIASHHPSLGLMIQVIYSIFISMIAPLFPIIAFISFPSEVRYTGVALCGNVATILGGTFPFIASALVKTSGVFYAPAIYTTIICLIAMVIIYKKRQFIKKAILAI